MSNNTGKGTLLANSEEQELKQHCIAVGIVAGKLAESITTKVGDARQAIVDQARLSGFLHDVGKADKGHQRWLRSRIKNLNFSSEFEVDDDEEEETTAKELRKAKKKWLFHNQLSYLALDNTFKTNWPAAAYAIYHHHTPSRNKGELEDDDIASTEVISFYNEMFQEYRERYKHTAIRSAPGVKRTDKFSTSNSIFTTVLICLIQADRWVSAIGAKLNDIELTDTCEWCPKLMEFISSQNKNVKNTSLDAMYAYQRNVVEEIGASDEDTFVVNGPAGCGKTMISLGFHNLFERQLDLFVAPRNTICESLFRTIEDDLNRMGTPKSRQLITASTVQSTTDSNTYLDTDQVIINVDSVLGSYFNHHKSVSLISFLTQPMVLDEYHELLHCTGGILHVMRNLIAARALLRSKTLLISATPVNILQDLVVENNPVKIKTITVPYPEQIDTEHTFHVVDDWPVLEGDNVWRRFNTISSLQNSYSKGRGIIVHSKYTSKDKKLKFEKCMEMYSRGSKEQIPMDSSPITESSLNISFKHAAFEVCSPESAIQSLGRVERFGQTEGKSHIYFVAEDRPSRTNLAFYRIAYDSSLAKKWKDFLKEHFHGKTLRKSKAFELAQQFNDMYRGEIDELIKTKITESKEATANIKTKGRTRSDIGSAPILADGGLRGTTGAYGVFLRKDGNNIGGKFIVLNEQDKKTVRDIWDDFGKQKMREAVPGKTFAVVSEDGIENMVYQTMFGKSNLDDVFRAARKHTQAIPLRSVNGTCYGFDYDDDPNIITNEGMVKVPYFSGDDIVLDNDQ